MTEEIYFEALYSWMALAVIIFFVLLKIRVPYGRHTNSKWGPGIPNKWAWFIMELPAMLAMSWFIFGGKPLSLVAWIVYILYMVHYFRRTFIYPFRLHENGKRMPIVIVLMGISFNIVNGFFVGYWFAHLAPDYPSDWFTSFPFIAGIIIFITGFYINVSSDRIVLNLRRGGRKGYFIPHKGLYRYVSAPNLLGEIIEWLGWAMLSWCLPTFSFALWSMANLIPRAFNHHHWYQEYFPDYPEKRKAIIPGLL